MEAQKGLGRLAASYGSGRFLAEFLTGAFAALVYKYYETELGLSGGYVTIAVILFSVWNAVNDPLIGHLTEKKTRFAERFGRRFLWIISGVILCLLAFVAIFAVPSTVQGSMVKLFLWLLISICLYDALYTVWEVNFISVFPDRFRSAEARRKTATISTAIGVLGIALGSILPTQIIEYGKVSSYIVNSLVFAGIALIALICLIPAIKETPEMIKRYLDKTKNSKGESFFSQLKKVFKERNFVAFIILFFFYQSAMITLQGSIHYVGDYILPGGASGTTGIFAGMLAGAVCSLPLWSLFSKRIKNNNQKLLIITSFGMAFTATFLFFTTSNLALTIIMFLWGIFFGGFWCFMNPAFADVIDEIVLHDGKRDDGIFIGFRAFFGRLSYASQAIIFWLVHKFTSFDNSAEVQSSLAKTGIQLHLSFIPAILILIGVCIYIKMNTLTPSLVAEHKRELEKRGL